MKKRDIRFASIPSTEEVAAERERLAYQNRYQRVLRSTIYILVVVAAAAVLLATLFLPVLQVSGDSMNPTLKDKDIILRRAIGKKKVDVLAKQKEKFFKGCKETNDIDDPDAFA